jgi:hypothetical protein
MAFHMLSGCRPQLPAALGVWLRHIGGSVHVTVSFDDCTVSSKGQLYASKQSLVTGRSASV